jgi:hypothetical protein
VFENYPRRMSGLNPSKPEAHLNKVEIKWDTSAAGLCR